MYTCFLYLAHTDQYSVSLVLLKPPLRPLRTCFITAHTHIKLRLLSNHHLASSFMRTPHMRMHHLNRGTLLVITHACYNSHSRCRWGTELGKTACGDAHAAPTLQNLQRPQLARPLAAVSAAAAADPAPGDIFDTFAHLTLDLATRSSVHLCNCPKF